MLRYLWPHWLNGHLHRKKQACGKSWTTKHSYEKQWQRAGMTGKDWWGIQGYGDMGIRGYGDTGIWGYGDTGIWGYGGYGDIGKDAVRLGDGWNIAQKHPLENSKHFWANSSTVHVLGYFGYFLNRALHGEKTVWSKTQGHRQWRVTDLVRHQIWRCFRNTRCHAEGEGIWCSARSYLLPWEGESLLITTTLGSDGPHYLTDCIVPGYKLHASKSLFPFWPGWGRSDGLCKYSGSPLALAYITATGFATPAV